jgi:hypothetical protein
MTTFRQLSGEGVIGVELKEERCGEGFGGGGCEEEEK